MTKQFRSVLNGEGAEGIKTAIKYFLHYHNLFSVEAGHLVDKLVRIRNHIAHGKQVCRKDVIWPVPQFFPLDQDTGDYLEVVQTVAGVAISSLLGLAVFQREWRELVRDTSPTKESVATFINDRRFADLSAVDYLKRNENNITPHCIAWFVANKELKLEKLEDATEALWKSGDTCEKFADELLLPAILLSDSNIKAIAEPCRKLITESTELSELKQFYRDLQYRGIELKWLLEFLRSTALDGGGSDSGETA